MQKEFHEMSIRLVWTTRDRQAKRQPKENQAHRETTELVADRVLKLEA